MSQDQPDKLAEWVRKTIRPFQKWRWNGGDPAIVMTMEGYVSLRPEDSPYEVSFLLIEVMKDGRLVPSIPRGQEPLPCWYLQALEDMGSVYSMRHVPCDRFRELVERGDITREQ